jgi:hypothetical protein
MTLEEKFEQHFRIKHIQAYIYTGKVETKDLAHDLAQIAEEGREVIASGEVRVTNFNKHLCDNLIVGNYYASTFMDVLKNYEGKPVRITLEVQ